MITAVLPSTISFWSDASGFGCDFYDGEDRYHVLTVLRGHIDVRHFVSRRGDEDVIVRLADTTRFGHPSYSIDGWKRWVANYIATGMPMDGKQYVPPKGRARAGERMLDD